MHNVSYITYIHVSDVCFCFQQRGSHLLSTSSRWGQPTPNMRQNHPGASVAILWSPHLCTMRTTIYFNLLQEVKVLCHESSMNANLWHLSGIVPAWDTWRPHLCKKSLEQRAVKWAHIELRTSPVTSDWRHWRGMITNTPETKRLWKWKLALNTD